jgi:hypothetical protein
MKRVLVSILVCLLCLIPLVSLGADDPPPAVDPFDALIAATSELADLAAALKPAADAVEAKEKAVARKRAELADAESAAEVAKIDFDAALAGFVAAIETLKEAALKIPAAGGGGADE